MICDFSVLYGIVEHHYTTIIQKRGKDIFLNPHSLSEYYMIVSLINVPDKNGVLVLDGW